MTLTGSVAFAGACVTFLVAATMTLEDFIQAGHCVGFTNPNWACLEQRGWGPDAWVYPFTLIALCFVGYVWKQERKERLLNCED